jgi:hypothetical protein
MMKNFAKIFCVAALLAVAGCDSNTYQPPEASQPHALIKSSDNGSGAFSYTWMRARVTAVDSKRIPSYFGGGGDPLIVPGQHILEVFAEFNLGFGSGGPFEARANVPVTLEAGKTYFSKAEQSGDKVNVWIEADNGQRASETIATNYHGKTLYIPIIIPAK